MSLDSEVTRSKSQAQRTGHGNLATILGIHPFPVDETLCLNQRRVFQDLELVDRT